MACKEVDAEMHINQNKPYIMVHTSKITIIQRSQTLLIKSRLQLIVMLKNDKLTNHAC